MTKEYLVNLYIKSLHAEDASEGTIKEYVKHIKSFLDYIQDKDLKEVNKLDVKLFRNLNPDLSKSYRNVRLSAIKSFFDFLVEDIEYLEDNPALGVKPLRIKEGDVEEKTPLTTEQTKWLLFSCKNSRDKAVLKCMLNLGLRISELINITLEDYEHAKNNDGELIILGKGHKMRTVYISDSLFKVIDKYLLDRKDSEYNNLFISNGRKPLDRSCVSRTIKTIAKHSGHFSDEEISKLHNHLMRHTCFTEMCDRGASIEVVAELAGHSSVDTTYRVYVHTKKERLANTMKNFEI